MDIHLFMTIAVHLLYIYKTANANFLIPEQQFTGYHFRKMLGQTCIYYPGSCGFELETRVGKPRINLSITESSYTLLPEFILPIYILKNNMMAI